MDKLNDKLFLGIKAAIKAGNEILKIYNSNDFEIEIKSDCSPLTKADKRSHKIIENELLISGIPIMSEEGNNINFNERKNWHSYWLIDPIDGTKEFIKRNGEFTVNIALIENNKPVLGIVYIPYYKTLYFANKNSSSYKIDDIDDFELIESIKKQDLAKVNPPKKFTVILSKSHMNNETQKYVDKLKKIHGEITSKFYGSSLKICKVADGSANCYPRFGPTMEWDTAAAHAIAIYSGCKIFNPLNNKELTYNKEELLNPYFIVLK